jgi:hypothetical protein
MMCPNNWNSWAWGNDDTNQYWMLQVTDPLNHFAFDVHHYLDGFSRGQEPNVRPDPIASMQTVIAWAKKYEKKIFCGEFACYVNKRGIDACRSLLQLLETNTDVCIGWSWWGGGGNWRPWYIYLLDPFPGWWDENNTNVPESLTWANPVDRPQMKLLQEFLPGTATAFNGWLIEDHLTSNIEAIYRRGDYQAETGIWIDAGPKAANASQATAGKRPVLATDGGAYFAASGHALEAAVPCGNDNEGMYAIVDLDAVTGTELRGLLAAAAHGGRDLIFAQDGYLMVNRNFTDFKAGSSTVNAKANLTLYQEALKNPATAMSQNLLGDGTVMNPSGYAYNGVFSAGSSIIGASETDYSRGLTGTIYDMVIYTIAPDIFAGDNARIQGRLYWDNGIPHLLPVGHAYRVRPPTI